MGRLIDADALLKMKFSNGMSDDGLLYVPFREVMRNIKEAPTAYSVEKVMQELVEARRNCSEDSDCSQCLFGQIEDRCILAELQIDADIKKNNGWIPCSERLPKVETEVYIVAKRKYRDGHVRYITTTAMYEDGTVRENDSCWRWEDIEGEWDEDEDCYIIPEGWWENRHYNPDEVYNNVVDDEVIAWMPLPEPYQQKEGE